MYRLIHAVLLAVSTLLVSACATNPVAERAPALSLPPADSELWNSLSAGPTADRYQLLNTGTEALEWRLRAIDSATREIELQTFLWAEDTVGLAVLARLVRAADRGVKVRILLDDMFTVGEGRTIAATTSHPNIEFRIYNPYRMRPDSLVLRQLLNLAQFSRVDHRMHNKVMVIDSRAFIVGGRNLADEYFGHHELGNFRDLEVLGVGPAAVQLSATFDAYWNSPWALPAAELVGSASVTALDELRSTLQALPRLVADETEVTRAIQWQGLAAAAVFAEAQVLADQPAERDPATDRPDQLAAALVEFLDGAQQEILIASAYLVPTTELESALQRAEARGVQVRILTNSLRSNNHTAAHSAYRNYVGKLLGHGVDMHETRALAKDRSRYMLSPIDHKHLGLHAKVLVIDNELSFIGSANLDPRSLQTNTEMGLMIRSPELNRRLRDALALDFDRRNAWHLQFAADGSIVWIGDDQTLEQQPAESTMQRIEDWFFSNLPIGDMM